METPTIDLGKGVETLAHELGIAVDKVFPWFVHASRIEAITFFTLWGISFAILAFTWIYLFIKRRRLFGDNRNPTILQLTFMLTIFLTFVFFITTTSRFDIYLNKYLNPEYAATLKIVHLLKQSSNMS